MKSMKSTLSRSTINENDPVQQRSTAVRSIIRNGSTVCPSPSNIRAAPDESCCCTPGGDVDAAAGVAVDDGETVPVVYVRTYDTSK